MRPDQVVAIQQKICTPLGMAIAVLAAVKKLCPSWGNGVANMWCTQSPKPRNAVLISDSTIAGYPKIGRRVNASTIDEIMPSAGMKMM